MKQCAAAAAAAIVVVCGHATAGMYTFADFTFEQDNTPDQLSFLGNGALLGGAQFSNGNVTTITRSVGFNTTAGNANSGFTVEPGFDPSLSLGRQAFAASSGAVEQSGGGNSVTSSAVNMPAGNNGSSTRHGLSVSWSGGRALTNGAGDDFVVYESGSNPTSPEGFMVRVQLATGGFSDWYYESFDGFELYSDSSAGGAGGFSFGYDLSDLGLGDNDLVVAIQIANLISNDTIDGSDAEAGFVLFDGTGLAPSSGLGGYGGGSLDPDPLYVGILSAVIPAPGAALAFGICGLVGIRRRR